MSHQSPAVPPQEMPPLHSQRLPQHQAPLHPTAPSQHAPPLFHTPQVASFQSPPPPVPTSYPLPGQQAPPQGYTYPGAQKLSLHYSRFTHAYVTDDQLQPQAPQAPHYLQQPQVLQRLQLQHLGTLGLPPAAYAPGPTLGPPPPLMPKPLYGAEVLQYQPFKVTKPRRKDGAASPAEPSADLDTNPTPLEGASDNEAKRLKPAADSGGERPFRCEFAACDWAFSRQLDLRRHAKLHIEPMFHCPYWRNDPTCHRNGGAFNRLDVLKRHLKLVHYVQDKLQLMEHLREDPGWCRACQRMFPSSKYFVDHCLECAHLGTAVEWKQTDSFRYKGT